MSKPVSVQIRVKSYTGNQGTPVLHTRREVGRYQGCLFTDAQVVKLNVVEDHEGELQLLPV